MSKKRKKKSSKTKLVKAKRNFVVISNKQMYGSVWLGTKIYFDGKKPKNLGKDGKIAFGKHILEILKRKFERFRLIVTPQDDSITLDRNIYRVRISQKTFTALNKEYFERARDIKTDIASSALSRHFPDHFKEKEIAAYVAGTLSRILKPTIVTRLSSSDRDAINAFLPDYIATESLSSVNLIKAASQIKSLKELATDLEKQLDAGHSEAWWQIYIKKNILIIQQGYIQAIEKMNLNIGNTKFPDFSLVTHDNYLDILEIKKPDTHLVKLDVGRGNYHWDLETAKAIIQTENYIESTSRHADALRSYIIDNYQISMKAVRPRGIILAGDARKFVDQKQKDDFRLLSQSTKNIVFVTYDELLSRLQNYIKVLETYSQ